MSAHFPRRQRKRAATPPTVLVTLALSVILANPEALAGRPGETICKDREVATAHFKRGTQLYEQKKLEGALAAFRDSRSLCPSENNTLNIVLLLKDLDRPLDALDILDLLERDFPVLLPENAESVKELRAALEQLVGAVVFEGDYPDARILVDGKDVGTMPQARPLKLRIGAHKARIEMAGHQPLETTVFVAPNKNTQVAVALAAIPVLPREDSMEPTARLAQGSVHIGVGLSLTSGLGGKVTDCDNACSASPGLGSLIVGGYRKQIMPFLSVGATAGYLFLWQSRSKIGETIPLNASNQLVDVNDNLFLNAFFAGPEVSTSFDVGGQSLDFGLALGPIAGPLVNTRTVQNGRSPAENPTSFDFEIVPTTKTSTSGFGGIFFSMQASWRTRWSLVPGWPLQLTMGVFGFTPMNIPSYSGSFSAHFKDGLFPDRPVSFDERLIGSWSLVFTPGITVYHDL